MTVNLGNMLFILHTREREKDIFGHFKKCSVRLHLIITVVAIFNLKPISERMYHIDPTSPRTTCSTAAFLKPD